VVRASFVVDAWLTVKSDVIDYLNWLLDRVFSEIGVYDVKSYEGMAEVIMSCHSGWLI